VDRGPLQFDRGLVSTSRPWSLGQRGELTPTMKVKCAVVLDRYASLVTEMYGDLDAPA
jgi:long-subunit acyl-CoA synthetase (AMP-forming)